VDYGPFTTPAQVATAAAGCVVLLADPIAAANAYFWHHARPWLEAVVRCLDESPGEHVREATAELRRYPDSVRAHEELCAALKEASPEFRAELAQAVSPARANSRVGYHLGAEYAERLKDEPCLLRSALPEPRPRATPVRPNPKILVVVPFRDRKPGAHRFANLTACLASLRDQSLSRRDYSIMVVESDGEPLWRERIKPLADQYVHAYNPGPFNKSWAVNVGVVAAGGQAPLICVLDGDALVDRQFLERNLTRFRDPAVGAVAPFRDLLYLDEESTSWAATRRCVEHDAAIDADRIRGFLAFRPPGVCVWLRRDVFERVNGFDERYEGWGGEDLDFVLRVQTVTAFHYFADLMLHMNHPFEPNLVDATGNSPNRHLRFLTWEPTGPIGDPAKYQPLEEHAHA
jgi:hypothetical protein